MGLAPKRKPRVLVVDDCRSIGVAVRALLGGDCSVLEASDVSEALAVASESPLDLVILDLSLKTDSGEIFLEKVGVANVPILLFSGEAKIAEIASRHNVQAYLAKNCPPWELLKGIAKASPVMEAVVQERLRSIGRG